MRRARWFVATGVAVLAAAGLATATPGPVPQADPIGDVISPSSQVQTPVIEPTEDLVTETPAMRVDEPTTPVTASAERQGDEEMPLGTPLPELADPLPRPRQGVAIVQALDKVTAETIRFAVPVGQQRRWRGLVFRARACETTAPDEPMPDSMAYLEIYSQPRARDGAVDPRRIFQGWMFASAPGLSGMQHPLYDAWVIACQAEAPSDA